MFFKKIKNNTGFTIIETLVAVSILSISILATYTAVQGGLQKSTTAKDRIIAFYLGQEAMEFIKNKRDENALKSLDGTTPTDWLSGIAEVSTNPCYFGKTCIIDSPAATVTSCSGGFGTCPLIKINPANNLMGYTAGWTDTSFRREIQLQEINPKEVKVTVRVSWTSRGVTDYIEVNEIIFDHN